MIKFLLVGAVDGVGTQVRFNYLYQIAVNSSNENILYIADYSNSRIRRCDTTNRTNTIVTYFMFINTPSGLVLNSDLKYLFSTSHNLNQLFKIQVSTATIIATYGSKYYLTNSYDFVSLTVII